MRSLAFIVFVLSVAAGALAGEPSMQVPGKDPLQLIGEALPIVWTILGTLFPVFVAFYRKDRDALERLLKAVPDIWDAVQQEKRKGREQGVLVPAIANAQARALEIAAANIGRPLVAAEVARVTTALAAYHERMGAVGAQATPVPVPTVAVPCPSPNLGNFKRLDSPTTK